MKKSVFLTDGEVRLYLSMLCSSNPALIKRAMQHLCIELEKGRLVAKDKDIISVLYSLKYSSDVKVRGWLYNLIARLKAKEFRDYLIYQILFNESDEENRTWAVAALFAITPADQVKLLISRDSFGFYGSPLELSSLLYSNTQISGRKSGEELVVSIERDPIVAKWFALLFGYNRVERPDSIVKFPDKELIQALNKHDNMEVVEYSFWSLHKNPFTNFRDSALTVDQMLSTAPNARRWAYRLLAKDRSSFLRNKDDILAATFYEEDELAREGLAQGVEPYYDPQLASSIISWFNGENSNIVKISLLRHMIRFRKKNNTFREIIESEMRNSGQARLIHDVIIGGNESGSIPSSRSMYSFSSKAVESSQMSLLINVGEIYMSGDRTINNIAVGGSSIDSANNSGDNSNVTSKSNLGPGEFLALAEKFKRNIDAHCQIDEDIRDISKQAADELVAASSDNNKKGLTKIAKKAIMTLSGISSSIPHATEFVENANEFIDAIKKTFMAS